METVKMEREWIGKPVVQPTGSRCGSIQRRLRAHKANVGQEVSCRMNRPQA